MRRGRAWKKRARRTATASLPLWARIPRFYIWNNELERAKDAICERPLNLYVCRRGALWLAYHRTQTQSATQWEFLFNPSTDIDSYYSYDTRTRQKCFIRTGYSFQPSIRLNSNSITQLSAAHPWCESPVPPHPKGALLYWDLVSVEAIWLKWTHCHVQETSPRGFELCDMVHYPAGSNIRRWVHCSHKGMDMVSNNTQVGCGV